MPRARTILRMNNHQLKRIIQHLTRGRSYRGRGVALLVIALMLGYGYLEPILEERFGISLPSISRTELGGQTGTGSQTGTAPRSQGSNGAKSQRSDAEARKAAPTSRGEQAVLKAFENRQSDLLVEVSAEIKKNLPDDTVGSRHQKMILRLPSGHTVLLAHNIDLAERVPANQGDTIRVKGEYEYTEQGGVIHWTHHDPGGRHEDGWIEYEGKRYE